MSAAAAVIVAALALLFPDGKADAGRAAATPVAEGPASVPHTGGTPTPSHSATTAQATPSAGRTPRTASPGTATTAAKPSAADPPRGATGSAPPAGRIRPGRTYEGVATFYDSDGTGACLYDRSDDVLTGAMNSADYESAKACGAFVSVRAADGASVTVRITNECPGECRPGQIDLSAQAFAKLADPTKGRIPITWKLVSPAGRGPMSIRYKTGSSRYWCGIQVIGHRNPVARLEVRAADGWRELPRTDYNYFLSETGAGCGSAIRVTDIFGQRLVADGVAIRPNAVQPTGVQFARH
ncbi:expansin EXLX1 family cellulose-binding protein [Streptomyces sp. NPDC058964]|uniref:expansin EXLX1 family cellulose-binding protein n=1 Tax=Streptomyces sp. NPDC058964 TaxID=3346681 RepID=UPI00369A28B8